MRVYICASPDLMSANVVIAKYRDNVDLQSYGAVTRATATTKRPQFTFGGGCRILPLFNFFVRQHSRTVPLPQIATQNPIFFSAGVTRDNQFAERGRTSSERHKLFG